MDLQRVTPSARRAKRAELVGRFRRRLQSAEEAAVRLRRIARDIGDAELRGQVKQLEAWIGAAERRAQSWLDENDERELRPLAKVRP